MLGFWCRLRWLAIRMERAGRTRILKRSDRTNHEYLSASLRSGFQLTEELRVDPRPELQSPVQSTTFEVAEGNKMTHEDTILDERHFVLAVPLHAVLVAPLRLGFCLLEFCLQIPRIQSICHKQARPARGKYAGAKLLAMSALPLSSTTRCARQ